LNLKDLMQGFVKRFSTLCVCYRRVQIPRLNDPFSGSARSGFDISHMGLFSQTLFCCTIFYNSGIHYNSE